MKPITLILFLIVLSSLTHAQEFGESYTLSPSNRNPRYTTTGDLNGDALPDIITYSNEDSELIWYPNLGNTEFGQPLLITFEAAGDQLGLHDFDQDGDLDIMYPRTTSPHGVNYYENAGNNEFIQHTGLLTNNFGFNIGSPHIIGIADMDGDGDEDVVFKADFTSDETVHWLENTGNSTFGDSHYMTSICSPWSVVVEHAFHLMDIDADGDMDLIGNDQCQNEISWLANDGNGIFNIAQTIPFESDFIHLVNIDADDAPDLIIGNEGDRYWYEFNGATFDSLMMMDALEDVTQFYDFDGDGDDDGLDRAPNSLYWMENDGSGTFTSTLIDFSNEYIATKSYDIADLNGDGKAEVIEAYGNPDEIAVYEHNGSTGYEDPVFIADGVVLSEDILASDIDGDGDLDAVVAMGNSAYFENMGSGEFRLAKTFNLSFETVISGDFNNDGNVDLIFGNESDPALYMYLNEGSADFNLSDVQYVPAQAGGIQQAQSADIDADGDLDIFMATNNHLAWIENDGNGSFGPAQIVNSTGDAVDIELADFDGDGDLDVTACVQFLDRIVYHEYLGNGQFGAEQVVSYDLDYPTSVSVADINGDGHLDIVSTSIDDDKLAWYPNDGNGSFGTQMVVDDSGNGPLDTSVADFDEDGDQDIIATRFGWIFWYENQGNGQFAPPVIINQVARGTASITAADLDADGDPDPLFCSYAQFANVQATYVGWQENMMGGGCPEDISGDGVVDIEDFLALSAVFDQACTCPEDINQDGIVDVDDFILLNSAFGALCD